MKKLFSLALALAVCFGLTSCGGGAAGPQGDASAPQSGAGSSQGGEDVSQSEPEESGEDLDALLAQAEEINLRGLAEEHFRNLPEVAGQLNGKVVKLTGLFDLDSTPDAPSMRGIYTPEDGSMNDAGLSSAWVVVRMEFSEEDKAYIQDAFQGMHYVTVVGQIDEGVTEESRSSEGLKDGEAFTYESKIYSYTMSEACFVTDTFEYTGTLEKGSDGSYVLAYPDGKIRRGVQFREGEAIPPEGTEVTIRSKFVEMGGVNHLDAVIVK